MVLADGWCARSPAFFDEWFDSGNEQYQFDPHCGVLASASFQRLLDSETPGEEMARIRAATILTMRPSR